MNYKHAFHAGNHADVLKHIVLLALLNALKKKDAPLFVMDTHAGRGRYLLAAPESRKTGEADAGILRLMGEAKMPEVLERYLRAVEANNPVGALVAYPGSPLLVAQATVGFGYAMVDLAAISYLGLGVQPPDADWGTMVSAGQTLLLEGKPAQSLYAGLLIMIAVMAVTIFGERFAARAEARR
jgi:hypothetical protein